jgi:MFS family permease
MNLAPLRRRDYRLLFVAQSISWLGAMVTYVALPYQVYALTESSWLVGLLGLAELVPLLAAAFIGGALADAVDRRRLALVTDVALATGSLALALLALIPRPPTVSLFIVAAWMSAMSALQRPSLESLVQRLVPSDEMPAAAALGMLRGSVAMIAGPALGGALIATAGLPVAYM